jgi:hypothetical protein
MKSHIVLIAVVFLAAFFAFTTVQTDETESYYIYADGFVHGIPTGFMGEHDGKSLKLDVSCKTEPYKGESCLKLAVDNSETWRGLHIQFTGAWNAQMREDAKLPDLTPYDKLEFYAKADAINGEPYILSTIGVGGGGAPEDKVEDSYLEIGSTWKKYSFSIKGADFKRVNTLLFMVLPTGTLYLDEIRFTKKIKK